MFVLYCHPFHAVQLPQKCCLVSHISLCGRTMKGHLQTSQLQLTTAELKNDTGNVCVKEQYGTPASNSARSPLPTPHSFIPTLLSSLSRGLLQRDALLAASPSACTHIALEDRYAVVPSGELDQRVPPTHVEQPRPVTSPTAHAGHPTRPHTRHDDSYGSCLSSDGSKECVDAEGVSGPAEATQYEEQLHQSLCDALSVPDTDGDGGGGRVACMVR